MVRIFFPDWLKKATKKPWYLDENKFGSFGNHFLSSNALGVGGRGVDDGATTSLNMKIQKLKIHMKVHIYPK